MLDFLSTQFPSKRWVNLFSISLAFLLMLTGKEYVLSQELPSLADKPGTFEILSRTDYVMPSSGYSKADVTANLQRIVDLIGIVRQNSVLADIKGFMGRARIYAHTLANNCGYGVPARISFEFSDYLYNNKQGQVAYNTIEPPEWSIYVNIMDALWNKYEIEKCMFTATFDKKTIVPGIDLYNNYTFVIYDPSRPPYWVPVTVEEAFTCARERAKMEKDDIARQYTNQFLDKEWAAFSPADLKKPAYYGGNLSGVNASSDYEGQKNIFPPIVKVNPEYWNKNLPKSAIQFIVLQMSMDKKYLQREYEDCVKHKYYGETCNLERFLVSYNEDDIKKLTSLIGK